MPKSAICLFFTITYTSVLLADAARILYAQNGLPKEQGDPSGYSGYNAARVITMPSSGPTPAIKTAITPEAAEASSNAAFVGVNKLAAPSSRRSYATVESDPITLNANRREVAVLPRQRSVMDIPTTRNLAKGGSGNDNMPALVVGGVAHAQTYEGASSTSATDALPQNLGVKKTVVAWNTYTSVPGVWKQGVQKTKVVGSQRGSWAVTSAGLGSLAVSGTANGKIVLAQAESAAAMAQSEKVSKVGKFES